MKMTEELYVANRNGWRAWLRENHDIKNEIWLIYYKRHTGRPSIPYGDSVEEALCFGWVDSIIKKIDYEKFARKFTPRKSSSKWSETNKQRARKMIEDGKMTKAGLTRIKEAESNGEWFKTPATRRELEVPLYLKKALAANKKASDNSSNLANTYKRHLVAWISSAKKEETRMKRLEEALRLLEKNEKLGMK
jgi:uncharacterized protein YdeI (YjbR/CyaY-like superfamily)